MSDWEDFESTRTQSESVGPWEGGWNPPRISLLTITIQALLLPTRLEFSPLQKLYMARYEKWIWSSDFYHYFGYISYTASISSTMTLVLLVLGTINT